MSGLFSIHTGVLALIMGLALPLPPVPPDPDPEADDPEKAELQFYRAKRNRGLLALARLLLIVFGTGVLIGHCVSGLGSVNDTRNFILFTGLFTGLMLAIQRAERNRRLATFFFMGFSIWMVWQYAQLRDHDAEAAWGIYLALVVNALFWMTIGQRYPVGSSKDIQVWGMDD